MTNAAVTAELRQEIVCSVSWLAKLVRQIAAEQIDAPYVYIVTDVTLASTGLI